MQIEFDVPSDLGRLIVQESLTNIHRHSGSRTAMICIARSGSEITLEIKDRGSGMREDATPGVGIASMRERAQQLGGRLEVGSQNGGTRLTAVIPLSSVSA
jgi:signal transduction histidine kinase